MKRLVHWLGLDDRTNRRDLWILGLIILVIALINVWWRATELRPPHWDMGRHLTNSLDYLNLWRHHSLDFFTAYYYYPPLVYWATIPFYLIFGTSLTTAVGANIVFITILAVATYGLGREVTGDRRVGLLAATFALASPMMVSQFKEYQIDAPLAAMVALSLWLLMRTRGFSRKGDSWLFGVVFGLGLLTKWTFPFIMATPLVWAVYIAVRQAWRTKNWQTIENLFIAALLALVIALPWYSANHFQIKTDLKFNNQTAGQNEGDPALGSWQANLWYLSSLLSNQLYLLPFLALLIGFYGLATKWRQNRGYLYPVLLIAGTYLFLTLLRNKDARFFLPTISAISVVAVSWLVQLQRPWRQILIGFTIVYCLVSFWFISLGWPMLNLSYQYGHGRFALTVFRSGGYLIAGPTNEDWHQADLFRTLAGRSSANPPSIYYMGSESLWFNGWGLHYYSMAYHVPMVSPREAEYLVVRLEPGQNLNVQNPIAKYQLPDGSTVIVAQNPLKN